MSLCPETGTAGDSTEFWPWVTEPAFVGLRMPFASAVRDPWGMTTYHHAVVWIDHQVAKVVHFDADSSEPAVVHSSHPHQHLHHKANSGDSGHAPVDKKFLEQVA